MRTNDNMEVILSAREASYIAGLIHELVRFTNGNKDDEDEGMWIGKNRDMWATPETCYHMMNLMKSWEKTVDISIYQEEINKLKQLSKSK